MLRKLEDDGLAPAGTHAGAHAISALFAATDNAELRSKIVDAYVYGLRGVYGLRWVAVVSTVAFTAPGVERA
ncbi:hypothetical protein CABS01_17040 [Colletotrichum abscissum]|uniref:uncharacterized protein n=1 Tax=Colletotrichum abscissum TaxID=1671311 RepID=UPI0027D6E958|nr:uncharacterized protein CABS01_17040 [Colletotrichum abscissum]KAK1498116.1 hypothetical protein CABS01_17040 [Colletotrichum abscissum]